MLDQEHLGVGSLYSLPPEFVRHENEEPHDHAYDLGDAEEPEGKSFIQRMIDKLHEMKRR